MYLRDMHDGIQKGGSGRDVLLTHAVARIIFNNYIDNIQMSWVKEGPGMSQMLLQWGANDFGGTLINESISTSAGSGHGQLLKPREIRQMIRDAGRIPAERDTKYNILRRFDDCDDSDASSAECGSLEHAHARGHNMSLDDANPSSFGSYAELIKTSEFHYKNPRQK